MEFRILGPLVVIAEDRKVQLGGGISQRIIGGLLLSPNRVVTMDRLAELAWDTDPPPTCRRQLQNRVAALRHLLARRGGVIETHEAGYLIRIGDGELDADRFGRLVAEADAAAEPARRSAILRQALGLWRGPALAGLSGMALGIEAAALEDRKLAALGDCLDAELELGLHDTLIAELRQLVAEHPLRERFVGQWMIALARSGRQSEALDVYQELRRRLVDDLGVEPGPDVRQLHQTILRSGEPAAGPVPPPAPWRQVPAPLVPRQLPADVRVFVGRQRELTRIRQTLTCPDASGPVPIVAIHGLGGAGKSALSIHAAHQVTEHFPDGQLYVDLQGWTAGAEPLRPEEVLGRFLRALGVDWRAIPATLEEAAARFRSEAASRRLLVVLDNAGAAAQIAPLLPGAPSCGVLITSRTILASIEPTIGLSLDYLSPDEATLQLERAVGAQRISEDPGAAADVTRWCGYLPLALRIAGARLAARPSWPLRSMAVRLADEQRRLDELELADASVRASIAVSHGALGDSTDEVDRAATRAFVTLGLLDGQDISLAAAAHLLDEPQERAERVLERLVDAALLDSPGIGRYRLHDLVRLYAREQAETLMAKPGRIAAITRAYGFYLAATWQAYALIRPGDERPRHADGRWSSGYPGLRTAADALRWLESEQPNLMAAVRQSAVTGGELTSIAIQLAHALYAFFRLRGYWNEVTEVNEIALALLPQTGDRASRAMALGDLGTALGQLGHYSAAADKLAQAIVIYRDIGDRYGQAQSLTSLGVIYKLMGRHDDARACCEQSQAIHERQGNARGQAMALDNLGALLRQEGRYAEALECHKRAIAIFRQLGDQYGQAVGLTDLGLLYTRMGRCRQARSTLDECLGIFRDMGDRPGEAEALSAIGMLHREEEDHEAALLFLKKSLAIYRDIGRDREATKIRGLIAKGPAGRQPADGTEPA